MPKLPADVAATLDGARTGHVVVLAGAGISAESGIPTFRGPEGYWRVGSREYHPMDMATRTAFFRMPDMVWGWYLYRRTVCRHASPNAGHESLVALERGLGDRFTLVTQNVDGLHLRAGNTFPRTMQIHGNIDYMRCADECSTRLHPIPEAIGSKDRGQGARADELALLVCPDCGGRARPHVLWFDECYDESRFRADTALHAALSADLLVVVGTSGATNLPLQIAAIAARNEAAMIDINPEDNPFARIAGEIRRGHTLQNSASEALPAVVDALL